MREIGGLKTRIALLNNYDLKEANNKATRPSKKNSDPNRLYYYVNELGATFWSTGPRIGKWSLSSLKQTASCSL
jgi:hypothetical protein